MNHSIQSSVRRYLALCAAVSIIVCALQTAGAGEATGGRGISLGIMAEVNRAQIQEEFGEFVRYVAAKLDSGSGMGATVVIASTAFELAKLIEQHRIDFYMESPYPTYLVNDVHGVARLLLRRWKRGMAEYRSLIVAKNRGSINRLEDLKGKAVAFEDPESTSGYFLPHSFLRRKGFNFTDKKRFDPYASATDVAFVFAYSPQEVVNAVLSGKTAAGAISDDDYARLEKKQRSEITVLAQTEPLPRHLLSVRSDFSPQLLDRLRTILLAMHEDNQGRRILKNADETTKFDLLPEGAAGLRRKLQEIFAADKKQ